jgi:ketopantoate reductase
MRIAAMAADAVGGYFAARLAAAGHDVFFIARGAHRDAIAKNGLTVESALGNLCLPKPNVTRACTHNRRGCLLSAVKRTWPIAVQMSAYDPKRTSTADR